MRIVADEGNSLIHVLTARCEYRGPDLDRSIRRYPFIGLEGPLGPPNSNHIVYTGIAEIRPEVVSRVSILCDTSQHPHKTEFAVNGNKSETTQDELRGFLLRVANSMDME